MIEIDLRLLQRHRRFGHPLHVDIDGKPQRTYSTACRNSYGEWELQQS